MVSDYYQISEKKPAPLGYSSFVFAYENYVCSSHFPHKVTCSAHLIRSELINLMTFGGELK
jgi:hypothetical protein